EFRQGTLPDVSEVGAYDLVFARFLLTHLPDPEGAVRQMLRTTCPGGALAVEDIDFAGHFSFPRCPAFDRYVELYQEVVRRKGGDAQIGPRLLGLLLDAGLEDVRLRVVLPAFRQGRGKRLAPVTLEHIKDSVVAAGLASANEVDGLVRDLH